MVGKLALIAALMMTVMAGVSARAQETVHPAPVTAPAVRDGSHDYDFNEGTWHTHLIRRKHPLSGSDELMTMEGTVSFHPLWGHTGWYEEIEADGPVGHWEGMTLFLYNPKSGQWSQRFVNAGEGAFSPAMFGTFKSGTAELYSQDSFKGRGMQARGVWSNVTPNSHTYQESWTRDGGKTWEVEITATLTRVKPVEQPAFPPSNDGGHDFDFDHGLWHTRSERMLHPLTGSKQWITTNGTTRVTPIWGGRANIAEFASDGPAGHLELISLRLFDPVNKEWNLNFAVRGNGMWSTPMFGGFHDGHGDFFDQEEINGRMTMVRFRFTTFSPDKAQSEQAFSIDGGQHWETNWINHYDRLPTK